MKSWPWLEVVLGTVPCPRGGIRPSHMPAWMFPACALGAKPIIRFEVKKVFFSSYHFLRM